MIFNIKKLNDFKQVVLKTFKRMKKIYKCDWNDYLKYIILYI